MFNNGGETDINFNFFDSHFMLGQISLFHSKNLRQKAIVGSIIYLFYHFGLRKHNSVNFVDIVLNPHNSRIRYKFGLILFKMPLHVSDTCLLRHKIEQKFG